jgi:hypothetical protein
MNVVRGPWTEHGANFASDAAIVRGEVADFIAREIKLCSALSVSVCESDVDIMEEKLWNREMLKPGSSLEAAYPGLLEEVELDYYTAA